MVILTDVVEQQHEKPLTFNTKWKSGAAENILTAGNISASENSNVTLQCHLSMTNITVSLVTWDQCNQVQLAVYLNKDTGRVQPAFMDKISLAAEYGIIVHLLGVNDTGDYCCKFHTFPDGLYEGRVSLEMTASPKETALGNILPYVIIWLIVGVFLITCFIVWILKRKEKPKIHMPPRIMHKGFLKSSQHDNYSQGPIRASVAQEVVASTSSMRTQEDSDGSHEYFNVLQYKSHKNSSMSAVVQIH
ncbi:T-cell immunoreceptor with Ig and ITIM domains [Alligator sinensis]|uniref:T-cell immunoreceptor with Ig and ITIM domains n=1 Tax=Alligator sinensis TaxID=38654 RepID=UPI000D71EBC7|nr:T-cell immunoreceptor with Ig and ITIM domains [Alligator sinensis]